MGGCALVLGKHQAVTEGLSIPLVSRSGVHGVGALGSNALQILRDNSISTPFILQPTCPQSLWAQQHPGAGHWALVWGIAATGYWLRGPRKEGLTVTRV